MRGRAAVLVPVWLALGGWTGEQSALDPAADQASSLHGLLMLMLWVCGFMYLLVLGFLAWALWRARGRRLQGDAPEAEARDPGLEKVLSGWTGLVAAGILVLTAASFLVDRSLAQSGPRPLKIRVTAQQWWWQIQYQDPDVSRTLITANELHLPANRTAEIELVSQDVIHSFWVPNLHGKEDLIPGRTNHIVLTPRKWPARRGQCAEFCGLQHANMAIDVTVETPGRFQTWMDQQLKDAPEPSTDLQKTGRQVFMSSGCVLCHTIQGTDAGSNAGPDLTHIASRRSLAAGSLAYDRGALAGWINDPQAFKPGAKMPRVGLGPEQLNAVVDYLDSLK